MNIVEEQLLQLGSATLYEASNSDIFLDTAFRPAWEGAQMVGRAVPVTVARGDNLSLHHAIEEAGPGDVIVADAGGAQYGYWGEVLAVAALTRGIRGLIIDGGVRDTAQLVELDFPVFSTSIAIRGTVKEWAGAIGFPITLRGRVVNPGDIVIADRDGVAVIPATRFHEIVQTAQAREAKEREYIKSLRDDARTLDLYNLRNVGEPLRKNPTEVR